MYEVPFQGVIFVITVRLIQSVVMINLLTHSLSRQKLTPDYQLKLHIRQARVLKVVPKIEYVYIIFLSRYRRILE
jgi:hypothetical protein